VPHSGRFFLCFKTLLTFLKRLNNKRKYNHKGIS
jgi:hypothetical protein